jgi:lipopolysaccharide transport system permease protein
MIKASETLLGSGDLLREWTVRTLRARYQQSMLGWLWAVVQPAAQALILAVVFTRVVPIDVGDVPYFLFAFVATAPWAFFASSLTDMTDSLVTNMSLVNKIYFPREVLPIASMVARLADLAVAAAFFGLAVLFYGAQLPLGPLIALPVVVLVHIALTAGLGLAGAALNVFVRDVRPILALVLQLWFYASPVLYPVEKVPGLRPYYDLNPMVGIIDGYRSILTAGALPDGRSFALAAGMSIGICVAGYGLFKAVEYRFADVV